ncbi:transcriptional regulator with XRE-family HTH domain [Crossiella equi]|uniref:Transcriptional regulator with XRE-family HTH domain n=1 Tax=Crossiella equi TaxID=130796 RepID=A0ABS5ADW2_9PSEU|nr:helix-turn-helix transcriptional regulator [Crossiella equi]MBP2474452.1 transcriptional regulator with XRE-family HTH domain [Crossiella equi]
MTSGGNPVAYQRRLRGELRRAREAAGVTQKAVAEALDWSPSKVIRIETGAVGISTTDLRALLAFYGTEREVVEELVEVAKASRQQVWWDKLRGSAKPSFLKLIALESSASLVRQFQSQLVPGLLQDDGYMRAIVELYENDLNVIASTIEIRKERQARFFAGGTRIFFVLDEAVIRRAVGGKEVMRKQLEKLVEMNKLPQVSIQIAGFDKGAHVGMYGSYVVYDFEGEQDNAVYIEASGSETRILENSPDETSKYLEWFYELEALAEPAERLEEIVERVISESFS